MLFAIGIAQHRDLFLVDRCRNVGGCVDGIEIPGQRNGEPIIAVDLVIAADDDAKLAVMTGAKGYGRIRANVIQIDRSVAGWIHRPELAIGFFHQKERRMRDRSLLLERDRGKLPYERAAYREFYQFEGC